MSTILVCLHGWGGSKESFTELRQALTDSDIEILTPDLPGFGAEPEPKEPWTVDDFTDWVLEWLSEHINESTNQRINVLGHSHGGRIAIKLAHRQSTNSSNFGFRISHLYLCAPAGIHRPRHVKRVVGLTLAKAGKTLLSVPGLKALQPIGKKLLYKLVRVHDYEKASEIMRQTLINTTKEDLRPLLSSIDIPTDIFWGEDDGMVPVADAHVMHSEIKGSELHLFPGIRHRLHRDKAGEIGEIIKKFAIK